MKWYNTKMGIFDRFLKKQDYDPTNLSVFDLNAGFAFDYDMATWTVLESATYDWGKSRFTYEMLISNGTEQKFLEIDKLSRTIEIGDNLNILEINRNLVQYVSDNGSPPQHLTYQQQPFFLVQESAGYYLPSGKKARKKENWDELMCWDYQVQDQSLALSIIQWGERDLEASIAKPLKEFEISNISPGE